MAPNRKRHAIEAPDDAWKRLGELLEYRRKQLGYQHRPAFARARLGKTPGGNLNLRMPADIEKNYRPNTYPPGTLRQLADAYRVTYESVTAVLSGEATELSPVQSAPAPASAAHDNGGGRALPTTGEDNAAASWLYAEAIWERLYDLAAGGNSDPAGADLFGEGTDDARTWDDPRLRRILPLRERVRNIADLRRREAAPPG